MKDKNRLQLLSLQAMLVADNEPMSLTIGTTTVELTDRKQVLLLLNSESVKLGESISKPVQSILAVEPTKVQLDVKVGDCIHHRDIFSEFNQPRKRCWVIKIVGQKLTIRYTMDSGEVVEPEVDLDGVIKILK